METKDDLQIIRDYLLGAVTAYKLIDDTINAAFSKWTNSLGDIRNDITSDAHYKLLVLFRNGTFRGDCKLSTYIGRIVSNTCIDYIRIRSRIVKLDIAEIEVPESKPNPEKILEIKQDGWILFRVLRRLPHECITMWRMVIQKRLTSKQIGDILGHSESNVRHRMMNCRNEAKKIKQELTNS